jgi:uncharacterized tellurite resistance protein B-like protein
MLGTAMSLLDALLGRSARNAPSGDTDTVRRIVGALDRMDPARARYIAAFAYILGRVALADRHCSDEETRTMERLVMRHGGLPEEQAVVVVQIAKSQNALFGGTEDFLVTREFNELATPEQKLSLLDCLYAVSAADDSIATVEDNEIRRIALELHVPFDAFIRVRLAHRARLAVLKPGPEGSTSGGHSR